MTKPNAYIVETGLICAQCVETEQMAIDWRPADRPGTCYVCGAEIVVNAEDAGSGSDEHKET